MVRRSGQTVTLLITTETTQGATSTNTPFSVVTDDTATQIATAYSIPIYAFVHWHDIGDIEFQEGGQFVKRKATIEASGQWKNYLQQCFGVKLEDEAGIFKKVSMNYGDTGATFSITVEGEIDQENDVILPVPVPPGGDMVGYYTQTFATASTTWTIVHNLNGIPAVTLLDSTGEEIFGDLTFPSLNTCIATFSAATGGTAYCAI
jgi:hypothetical protein